MSHSELPDVLRRSEPEISCPENFAALGQGELYYLHFDEREPGVVAAFYYHSASRDLVRDLGGAQEHNTVSFFVSFRDVRKFRASGWGAAPATVFVLNPADEGLLEVTIRGPETGISLTCSQISLDHVKTYKAGTP